MMERAFYLLWSPAGLIWLPLGWWRVMPPTQDFLLRKVLWNHLVLRARLKFGGTCQTSQVISPGLPLATLYPELDAQVPRSLEMPKGCQPTMCMQRRPWLLRGSGRGLRGRSGLGLPVELRLASRK